MARKRQSKENWRKRGAVFDEASRAARERKDQLVRTGGSVAQISDADLFVVDKSAKPSARKPRAKADPKAPKQLWVERNVAPNPHIPTVGKVETSRALQLRERRVAKLVGASQRRRAHGQPSAVAPADGAELDIWAGAAAPARKSKRPRPAEPSSQPAISVAPEGASYRPSHAAHQVLLLLCCRCCCAVRGVGATCHSGAPGFLFFIFSHF